MSSSNSVRLVRDASLPHLGPSDAIGANLPKLLGAGCPHERRLVFILWVALSFVHKQPLALGKKTSEEASLP